MEIYCKNVCQFSTFDLNTLTYLYMKTLTSVKAASAVAIIAGGLGMGALKAQPIYPTTVVEYQVGLTQDGLGIGVPGGRGDANNAIGAPQNSDINMGEAPNNSSTVNFTSLGFGGHIILKFDLPFGDGEGHDLTIYETSYNTPPCGTWPERANVYVSQDGCNWVLVAENQCQNFNVELPDNMPWGLYVKIEDVSPAAAFNWDADGYDVDGVAAFYLANVNVSAGPDVYPVEYLNYVIGNLKGAGENNNNSPAANRKNPNNAINAPSTSDVSQAPVFTTLGFDKPGTADIEGQITLRFDYTIFDKPGPDITVYETSFGDKFTSTDCAKYPEIAEFWGSNDGENWTLLAADPSSNEPSEAYLGGPGRLCRDGYLDISNMPLSGGARTLRYLKIVDKSIRSSSKFPNSADGYDVDGVVASICSENGSGKLGYVDQVNVPDEDPGMFFIGVFPNPASDMIVVNVETAQVDQNYSINITDVTGRVVRSQGLNASANASVNEVVSISELPSGVYSVSVEANGYKMIQKLVKR